MRAALLTAALVACVAQPSNSSPFFTRGSPGTFTPPVGVTQLCDTNPTNVCADHLNGQTRITWPDVDVGLNGANYRYRVYRSTSPITAANYTSASLIASYVLNNSGQLFGGDPANPTVSFFTQAYRQTSTRPMAKLIEGTATLQPFTGLQIYTALTAENGYYAVVATTTTDVVSSYLGSVGPIGESLAPLQPIKYIDSLSRAASYGKISGQQNLPVIFRAHASGSPYSCASVFCHEGDYWNFFLPTDSGWQDGRPTVSSIVEDVAQNWPSLPRSIILRDLDVTWNTLGSGSLEQYHSGLGMTPNPLPDGRAANRFYPTSCQQIAHELNFTLAHYAADPLRVHWQGHSMGAWGGASCGLRSLTDLGGPQLASLWMEYPFWRADRRSCASWPAGLWTSTMPFRATVASASGCWLGLAGTQASVFMGDGRRWGGDGGVADVPDFVATNPGVDLPFTAWMIGKYDGFPNGFLEQIEAKDAFQTSRHGHAFVWSTIGHESTAGAGPINCDTGAQAISTVCYRKSQFTLNTPYIAFSNSSIDDDPGTDTETGIGRLIDGDPQGCVNCGWKWNIISDTDQALTFTVRNDWMARNPTPMPASTLASSISTSGAEIFQIASANFLSAGNGPYALVGGNEVIQISSVSGTAVDIQSRGLFGTLARTHAVGEAIVQYPKQPTGPNGGPYTTMTADVAVRRQQGSLIPTFCTVTPDTTAPYIGALTLHEGIPVISNVIVDASGDTTIDCE